MLKIVTINDIKTIIKKKQLNFFFLELLEELKLDFARWQEFKKTPRHATHYPHGVIELMPISDDTFYSFKYVNGHPYNPAENKINVVALGLLADVASGYPLLISEMTLLTAFRTAATCALASTYLAPKNADTMAIIGTGSQSEFQILAHHYALGIQEVHYYDRDPEAMKKFAANLVNYDLKLIPAFDTDSAIAEAQIIVTATAAKSKMHILKSERVPSGVHINAIGGDAPGKTELDPELLLRSQIVVENYEQTRVEGEIQNLINPSVYAELWEIVSGRKPGRQNSQQLFIFDSVGFALEDYSILRYIYRLVQQYQLGTVVDLIPDLENPKDLFSLLS